MKLLAGLNDVQWDKVSHAYGPATDVPDLLRGLVDPSGAASWIVAGAEKAKRTVRDHVTWLLWGNVFHQGTVWQATPKVVPFLVEILRDGPDDVELRRFVITYLHHLALGYPEDLFPDRIDPAEYFAAAEGPPADKNDPLDTAYMAQYSRDCYLGVESALPTVATFVRSPDEEIAFEAMALQASFIRWRPRGAELLRSLIGEIDAELSPTRIAVALVALAQLEGRGAQTTVERYVGASSPFLSTHAACASVLADPDGVSDAAVSVLTTPLGEAAKWGTPFTETLGTLVSRCLSRLPVRQVERAATAIGQNLANCGALANLAATGELLQLVFGEARPPTKARDLTPIQRSALESIVAHGAFTLQGSAFANYSLLLNGWGLPTNSERLREWLADG